VFGVRRPPTSLGEKGGHRRSRRGSGVAPRPRVRFAVRRRYSCGGQPERALERAGGGVELPGAAGASPTLTGPTSG